MLLKTTSSKLDHIPVAGEGLPASNNITSPGQYCISMPASATTAGNVSPVITAATLVSETQPCNDAITVMTFAPACHGNPSTVIHSSVVGLPMIVVPFNIHV